MPRQDMDIDEGCFVISVAARMLGVHAQTLRYYERVGIIEPPRSRGNIRLYTQRDIDRLRQIKMLMNDLGVNLAGVEVIIRMRQRMEEMNRELQRLMAEVQRLHRGRKTQPQEAHSPRGNP